MVGPSDSGKSTTVQLLQRLYEPEEGCVSTNARKTRGERDQEMAQCFRACYVVIGAVFPALTLNQASLSASKVRTGGSGSLAGQMCVVGGCLFVPGAQP